MSGEFTRSELNGAAEPATNGGSAPESPLPTSATPAPTSGAPNLPIPKNVEDVMYSDIGINTLLNRLKQSIASARDFAGFLKKRSTLEEEHATGLRRLVKNQQELLKRQEAKSGSFALQNGELMKVHERMAENGMQFALSLHQMHEDLNELSTNMERGRKQWKHDGLDAEKRAADAEAAMLKAKARYDALAEDYDRARTGDVKGSKRMGLKGPKSAEQYESDMLRKTQAADQDYEDKVKQAKGQRELLLNTDRPKAVRALLELIRECDSALTLQLQKFATFNEKLLLGNGLAVTPLSDQEAPGAQQSLRDIVSDIDNDTDFNAYVRGHKLPPAPNEIKYEQHPTLMPKTQRPTPAATMSDHPATTNERSVSAGWAQPQQPPALSVNTAGGSASTPGTANGRHFAGPTSQVSPSKEYNQRPSTADRFNQAPTPVVQPNQPPSTGYTDRYNYGGGQPAYGAGAAPAYSSTHPAERSTTPHQQNPQASRTMISPVGGAVSSPTSGRQYGSPTTAPQHNLPPLRPVFGVSLEELFSRDQIAVPLVVVQCILAVDTFGLDVEGIYRLSGTASHIQTLKSQFDHDSSRIDFRNPAAFMHDVNSVATLLKQFFRDLPDPLFTRAGYSNFIEAAKIESDEQRRDALHQNINDLPDPNYATLRALVLHLNRVMQNEGRNRMGSSNLAMCFAPSLMGTHTGPQIADASLQARVLDTILTAIAGPNGQQQQQQQQLLAILVETERMRMGMEVKTMIAVFTSILENAEAIFEM